MKTGTNAAEAMAGAVSMMPVDVVATARELAGTFAERAADYDGQDRFVAENYKALKEAGLVAAAVPRELGGAGAELRELCDMLRVLAQACGSTALAFAMHTHQVAIPAWRWRHQNVTVVEPLLRRIAAEQLILLSSGGSDWIGGSGKAEKVEGGYRITARKIFTSGAEAGDLMMTGAIHSDGEGKDTVIHFGAPMRAPEVKVADNWRVLGMRGTGSNDVMIEGLFVPDAGVSLSRQARQWHPLFKIISIIALPLIYAVYLGVAESARDIAIQIGKKKAANPHAVALAGRLDTALHGTRLAHRAMIDVSERNDPSDEAVNDVLMSRTLLARHGLEVLDLAMELAGGAAFYRENGLERRFRDMQGARFHPMQPGPQSHFTGAMALGQPIAEIF